MVNRTQNQGEIGRTNERVNDGKHERRSITAIWKSDHKDFGRYWIRFQR